MIYVDDNLLALDAAQLEREINRLPAWRREVVLRYRFDLGRRQSLLAYRLLCDGLRRDFAIDAMPRFEIGAHGKPYLPDYPQIHFNLSHCREAVACAIATHPVGIDVEGYRMVSDAVLRYAMSDAEIERIKQSPAPERTFTALWTQKEALVKLTGEGINDDIPSLLAHHPYRLSTLLTGRYALTLAEGGN